MTDRELLELAAKAAGYWDWTHDCWSGRPRLSWNPLADDGDALRLAVKLRLAVDLGGVGQAAETFVGGPAGYLAAESHGSDPYAATRRAIVRAAAEIGREMGGRNG